MEGWGQPVSAVGKRPLGTHSSAALQKNHKHVCWIASLRPMCVYVFFLRGLDAFSRKPPPPTAKHINRAQKALVPTAGGGSRLGFFLLAVGRITTQILNANPGEWLPAWRFVNISNIAPSEEFPMQVNLAEQVHMLATRSPLVLLCRR